MKGLPWYKRDVDAWRGGTRGMSMELRGFYSECLDAIWDLQGPIPKDPAKLAVMMATNPRTVRKLLPQLIGLGKLVETEAGYHNPRMMRDVAPTKAKPVQPELKPNSSGIHAEFEPKDSETQIISMADFVEVRGKREEKERKPPKPPYEGGSAADGFIKSRRSRRRDRNAAWEAAFERAAAL